MTAQIIDGKKIAQSLREKIAQEVASLAYKPGLAVVLVGEDPASQIYVNSKEKACQEVGFHSQKIVLPADLSQTQLLAEIAKLNQDSAIDGILVQMPLPKGFDEESVIAAISPAKDVDCLHPVNLGKLFTLKKLPALDQLLAPCTPKGILKLIDSTGVTMANKTAVVVGRSQLVGKPVAIMLLAQDATVTMAHSHTQDLTKVCLQADIIVAAVGKAQLITADMVKPGAVVIDVGINRLEQKIVGDVEFATVQEQAGFITPVPGGVGPMTIACLLENTLLLAKNHRSA